MMRWLVPAMLLVLALSGCTGKEESEADPTPTTRGATPTPDATPTRTTPATPAPTSTTPPTATPPGTPPTATPTNATPATTPTTPASTKTVEWTLALTAGPASTVPDPLGVGSSAVANCARFGAATVFSGNATATYEASSPLAGDLELIVLAPDGTVAARQAGPSPLTLTIPGIARGEQGPTVVVQFVEESPVSNADVSIEGTFVIPADAGAPSQGGPESCPRVE